MKAKYKIGDRVIYKSEIKVVDRYENIKSKIKRKDLIRVDSIVSVDVLKEGLIDGVELSNWMSFFSYQREDRFDYIINKEPVRENAIIMKTKESD